MRTLILGIIAIIILGVGAYVYNAVRETVPEEDEMVACTMDARICPDGSAVGRVAPNCEFAPCPGAAQFEAEIELFEVE